MKPIALNAGCARRPLSGYINLDIDLNSKADVICDLRNLPFSTKSVSRIRCIHVLEHMEEDMWREKTEVSEALLEFSRVLTDDGSVEIEVPSPQGQDAVRGEHLTVYGHLRLRSIFGCYFEKVRCWGVDTWVEAYGLRRIFKILSRYEPFWGNSYGFELSKPKKLAKIVIY